MGCIYINNIYHLLAYIHVYKYTILLDNVILYSITIHFKFVDMIY